MPQMPITEEIPEITTGSRRYSHGQGHGGFADIEDSSGTLPPPPQSIPNQKPNTNSGPRKILFVFLKWVVMTFVLILFLIFIGFAALVVLHFFLTSSADQHHRLRRRRGQLSPHNFGIHPNSVIPIQDLLPCIGYSPSDQTTRDCAICLEGFKEGDLCRKLPDCSHLFHAYCVDSWIIKKPNCPICRTRVQLNWGPSGSMHNGDDEWKFWWPVRA